jgi:hypothetical protein
MLWPNLLADSKWADRSGRTAVQIGVVTFGILALELAFIRWTSSQVRIFAYFNNIVLIAAFLGMGLGVALGRRRPGLVHLVAPALLLLALPLGFSEQLNLVHLSFPDHSISLWGAETLGKPVVFFRNLAIFLALIAGIVGLFVCAGAPLGFLFDRLPPLRAYTADLLGSLLGIVAFTLVSWWEFGPAVWLALGLAPFVWLSGRVLNLAAGIVVIVLGQYSVQGALFSPYNRIVLSQQPLSLTLEVNRDFHQYLHDFSEERLARTDTPDWRRQQMRELKQLYDLPFSINAHRDTALIVGAGTGNDVQAALRNGYQNVTSVDIDARIIALGMAYHPEQPYAHPGVRRVADDARAFFQKHNDAKFDVVCYGLLDSHAMASAMSTLRLDNYVYTEEGIRAAWQHVAPGGHLSLAISVFSGKWFFQRLYWTVAKATGREPRAMYSPLHGEVITYIVPNDGAVLDEKELARRPRVDVGVPRRFVQTPSDDWPFLYIRPGAFPWGYLSVLAVILVGSALTVPRAFGFAQQKLGRVERVLLLMGAAFLLIETRGVTSMSLLFGSTWIVNASIFGGILVMVLLANLAVLRWNFRSPAPWFGGLFAATGLLYFFPIEWLHTLPLLPRGILAGLLAGLPVGMAGVIVPMLLARAARPAVALGANLLGAVLGGCLEYYSMFGGLRSTVLIALVLYLTAFLLLRRRTEMAPAAAAPAPA